MKGIVFSEFMEMVEQEFGFDTVNEIVEAANLPSGGVYTAVGRYDHKEMVALVKTLSQQTAQPVANLLQAFGGYLFGTFESKYAHLLAGARDAFDFLERIEEEVHVEVLKLYPDAELPTFRTQRLDADTLQMDYHSDRAMGDLAHGLIAACARHFNESVTIAAEPIQADGKYVRFIITRQADE